MRAERVCFACDRKLGRNPALAITRDGQTAYIGTECYKLVARAGVDGWQPPKGGPRLFKLSGEYTQHEIAELRKAAVNYGP